MNKKQNGFASIEVMVIVVVLAVIGGIGYFVLNKPKTNAPSNTEESQSNSAEADQKENASQETKKTIPAGWVEYKNDDYGVKFAYPSTWASVDSRESTLNEGSKQTKFWSISATSPNSQRNNGKSLGFAIYSQPKATVQAREIAVTANKYAITEDVSIFGIENVTKIKITYNDLSSTLYIFEKNGKTYVVSGEGVEAGDIAQDEINSLFPYIQIY